MVGKPISQLVQCDGTGASLMAQISKVNGSIIHNLTNIVFVLLIVYNSITKDSKYMLQWTNVLTNSVLRQVFVYI